MFEDRLKRGKPLARVTLPIGIAEESGAGKRWLKMMRNVSCRKLRWGRWPSCSRSSPTVLLANHGLLAFHEDTAQTGRLIMVMEEAAEATLGAREIGGEKPFPPGALNREQERMSRFESSS